MHVMAGEDQVPHHLQNHRIYLFSRDRQLNNFTVTEEKLKQNGNLDDASGVAEAVAGDVVSEDEVVPGGGDSVGLFVNPHSSAL